MGRADRNSDRFSAGDTDFAQMIAGANVRNDSFDALASSGIVGSLEASPGPGMSFDLFRGVLISPAEISFTSD